MNEVWIFNGENSYLPSAAFSSLEKAEEWILANKVSGILTSYPIDESLYDWALRAEYFAPKKDYQKEAKFIQRFTSAYRDHYHYENGNRMT